MQQAATAETPAPRTGLGASLRAFLTFQPSHNVRPQVVILFCRQLASFVRVGVPVTTAIETFAEQTRDKRLRAAYVQVVSDIQKGVRLSDAFAAHPLVFPRIVADMVRSAEATGNLDHVLVQVAKHIQREASARSKLRAAMTYPVIIASFALVITIGIVGFVLPKFRDLYASLNVATPGILNALLNVSAFFDANKLPLVAGLLVAIIGLGFGWRTEGGRLLIDRALLRIPVVAALIRAAMIERFTRTLGDMLSAGVPISQTYAVVMANVRNRMYRRALESVAPALAAGRGIYRPLQDTGVFPPAVIQMIRVGEETGHLDANLIETADMYEDELDYRIKRLTALMEPALIVFVGIIVGFIAVTLITSIYSLAGGFR